MTTPAARVLLTYKNFGAYKGISHIGLGVSAVNVSKALNAAGVPCEVLALRDQFDLRKHLNVLRSAGALMPTHVVVAAPWFATATWAQLASMFPGVRFAMNCHSNVGFLQADAGGIQRLREALQLEAGTHNFRVAANSERLADFITQAYGDPCMVIPNLYYLGACAGVARPRWDGGKLRIGIFGATRALKNMLTAAGAALIVARDLGAETEIWINTGRDDGADAGTVRRAIQNLCANVPMVTVREANWATWAQFRKTVGSMNVLLQPSYTESFNMVTADGVHEGVPSAVSSAITWAPREWMADVDDVQNLARVCMSLVLDQRAAAHGLRALQRHNAEGLLKWFAFLR